MFKGCGYINKLCEEFFFSFYVQEGRFLCISEILLRLHQMTNSCSIFSWRMLRFDADFLTVYLVAPLSSEYLHRTLSQQARIAQKVNSFKFSTIVFKTLLCATSDIRACVSRLPWYPSEQPVGWSPHSQDYSTVTVWRMEHSATCSSSPPGGRCL